MKIELINELEKYLEGIKGELEKEIQENEVIFENFKKAQPIHVDEPLKLLSLNIKQTKKLKKMVKNLKKVIKFGKNENK